MYGIYNGLQSAGESRLIDDELTGGLVAPALEAVIDVHISVAYCL